MNAQDRYNSERYPDMNLTFLALRNIEETKERNGDTA